MVDVVVEIHTIDKSSDASIDKYDYECAHGTCNV